MPWSIKKSSECPESRPFAVVNDQSGEVEGCHVSEEAAKKQQAALYANEPEARKEKDYTAAMREKATTLPDGSYPIDSVADLKRAIQAFGRAKDKAKVKAWIIKRAKALGATGLLPEAWEVRSGHDFDNDRVEARSVAFTDVETSADGATFRGYAGVYGQEADLGAFTESIARGAFRKALASGDNVPMLFEHDPRLPVLATTAAGTLKLKEDAKGLLVEADVARHYLGDAVRELVKRGDIRGMSFGFVAGKGNSRVEMRGQRPHREIMNFKKLLDVSPTWEPAYSGTDAAFRSLRAIQMADLLEVMQQFLSGAYPQLEDGASPDEQRAVLDRELAENQDKLLALANQGPEILKAVTDAVNGGMGGEVALDMESNEEDAEKASEEQRSGVESAQAEAAARRRRLQMMGLSLPKGELKWMTDGNTADSRSEPLPREIDELVRYPRETWTVEEQRRVVERRQEVQSELFAIASQAERAGRNLTAEEAATFGQLQDEFERLRR